MDIRGLLWTSGRSLWRTRRARRNRRDRSLPGLARRLRPELAAIEVGRHNGYGHPAPSTLAALSRAHVPTYRTDRDGTITLTVDRGLRVATER